MNDAALVGMVKGFTDRSAQCGRLARRKTVVGQVIGQRYTMDKVADDINGVCVATHLVNADNVRVAQLCSGTRFS